jgi:hypothetical protein
MDTHGAPLKTQEMKKMLFIIVFLAVAGLFFFAWNSVIVIVPNDFRGVVKIVETQDGDRLGPAFPHITLGSNGVARLKSVDRLFGFHRVSPRIANSTNDLDTRYEYDDANSQKVYFWELPRSVNREAWFYIGSSIQYRALLKDENFLRELGRDRRSETAPFGDDSNGVQIKR